MKFTIKTDFLPEMEFLVIKGFGKLYDQDAQITTKPDEDTWTTIRRRLSDGSVQRLKRAAGSEPVYMLFCNTCVRRDNEKCYVCGYDIACENLSGAKAGHEFEIVRLKPCEYAVFDCEFNNEISLPQAHEKPDRLFWDEWLKVKPYVSAIDDPINWLGNGYAAIELYSPFEPDAERFKAKISYPLIRKNML